MSPWPGAFTTARGRPVKVHATRVVDRPEREPLRSEPEPRGEVVSRTSRACSSPAAEGTVELVTVQPEGKRAMRASEWVMGRGVAEGDVMVSGVPPA